MNILFLWVIKSETISLISVGKKSITLQYVSKPHQLRCRRLQCIRRIVSRNSARRTIAVKKLLSNTNLTTPWVVDFFIITRALAGTRMGPICLSEHSHTGAEATSNGPKAWSSSATQSGVGLVPPVARPLGKTLAPPAASSVPFCFNIAHRVRVTEEFPVSRGWSAALRRRAGPLVHAVSRYCVR